MRSLLGGIGMAKYGILWRLIGGSLLLGASVLWLSFASKPSANLRESGRRLLDIFAGLTSFKPPPRPIFLMHGLGSAAVDLTYLEMWIKQAYPGTKIFKVDMYERADSSTPLYVQVPALADYIRKTKAADPDAFQYGYDMVCHSQGALICRCLSEDMDDHEIHTLISLAGPQMGVFGNHFSFPANLVPAAVDIGIVGDLGNMPYSKLLQKTNSVSNMWNDPLHHEDFVKGNRFLPVYNGLTNSTGNARRKSNFLRLRKAVFFVGDYGATPYEGGLEPWPSGVFGFYKYGSTTEYMTMHQTIEYKADTFGLRTMEASGRLILTTVPMITHGAWTGDPNVVNKYIIPQLGGE